MILYVLIVILIVIFDQLTKYWATIYLKPIDTIGLINNVFHLTYVENKGAAFSLLQNQRWLFISVTIIIIIVLSYMIITKKIKGYLSLICASFIIGGGIGNLIDRIFNGFVVDFFDFRLINFAVFNVADSFVFIGGVIWAVWYFFFCKKERKGNIDETN